MNRRTKLYLNTMTALLSQIVTFVCGFILPRYILSYFGSDVNGLVTSITRFLSVIAFLELGIGPVIQSNLYKPLAENDIVQVSKIVISAERFYRKIAYIFLVYIAVLAIVFPMISTEFGFIFTASLVLIISISTFVQYYFGITYQVLLTADQRVFIPTSLSIAGTITNTIVCIILMKIGCSIQIVKLASAAVFVLRPMVQMVYVHKNYQLDKRISFTDEPISQKWNGFAQHLAAVVTEEIDVVLLTLFSTLKNVSVYSVYFMVVNGISRIVITAVNGLEALWGNMLAKKEKELLLKTFESVESVIHAGATVLFVAAAILVAPFVSVYTKGLEDAKGYYLPLFGILLTLAYGMQCLRIPYFRIIKAAGHYKETQNGAFIAMSLNIVLSVCLVHEWGLIGVAIGTLVAMLFHTVYFAWYLRKNILERSFAHFVKHMLVDVVSGGLGFLATGWNSMKSISYGSWIIYAAAVTAMVGAIVLTINVLLYHREILYFVKKILKKV